ncbi:MAG: hypothetical protein Q4A67_03670 [Aerococcus sp.]|nr:hypothetical protein [Aerococcus sp.]
MPKAGRKEDTKKAMTHDHHAKHNHDGMTHEHHAKHSHDEMTHDHHAKHNHEGMAHDHHEIHDHEGMAHDHHMHGHGGHANHHAMMIADMKKRFFVTLPLAVIVAWLSPMMMMLLGYSVSFPGQTWVEFILATIVFFYGGKPFLEHGYHELKMKRPGMMMLISLGIIASYAYSVVGGFFLALILI